MTKQQFFFRVLETVLSILGILSGYKWDIIGVAVGVAVGNMVAKLLKVFFIGMKLELNPFQISGLLFSSWRFSILLLPLCLVSYILLPSSWGGNIAMVVIFFVSSIIIFLLMPRFVGKFYYDEVYCKVLSYIKNKLFK
jgi:hypothetical protein